MENIFYRDTYGFVVPVHPLGSIGSLVWCQGMGRAFEKEEFNSLQGYKIFLQNFETLSGARSWYVGHFA